MSLSRLIYTAAVIVTLPLAAGFAVPAPVYAQGIPVVSGGDYTRMAEMEQQVRDLTNQLEQRDFQIRQLQSAFEKFSTDTNLRLADLESKISGTITGSESPTNAFETPAAPDTPPSPSASPSSPAAGSPNEAAVPGSLPDPNGVFKPDSSAQNRQDRNLGQIIEEAGDKDDATTSGKPQAVANAAQAYDQAFSYLQNNNYTDAQRAFSDFLKTYPAHPLAANAEYWLGEVYFAQTQYTTAAKTFAKAFQDHPQGQKAPDSLFRLAMTLEKLNKKEDACLTLQELSKRFPKGPSSVMTQASEESRRMGCPG